MTTCLDLSPSLRIVAAFFLLLFTLCASLIASPSRVAAVEEDEPGARLGLGSYNGSSGSLFGFIDRDRLSHSRSLAFGVSSGSGSARDVAGATYSDYFGYRLRDNLTMNLALHYNFLSSLHSTDLEQDKQFSVLPSFDLEYHPSPNTSLRFSYGRFGGGHPFLSGRPYFPY